MKSEERAHRARADDADACTAASGILELILQAEGVAARRVRDVALSEEELRARRDREVSVQVDHRIGQIVDSRFKAEAVIGWYCAEHADLRVQHACAEVKVALILPRAARSRSYCCRSR